MKAGSFNLVKVFKSSLEHARSTVEFVLDSEQTSHEQARKDTYGDVRQRVHTRRTWLAGKTYAELHVEHTGPVKSSKVRQTARLIKDRKRYILQITIAFLAAAGQSFL